MNSTHLCAAHWCTDARNYLVWITLFVFFCNCRNDGLGDGCTILDWDYKHLSSMSYSDAVSYTQSQPRPDPISCFDNPSYTFHFDQLPGTSIVQEVCLLPRPHILSISCNSDAFLLTYKNNTKKTIVRFVFYLVRSGIWFVKKAFGVLRLRQPYLLASFWAQPHLVFYRINTVEKHAL